MERSRYEINLLIVSTVANKHRPRILNSAPTYNKTDTITYSYPTSSAAISSRTGQDVRRLETTVQ